MDEELEQPCCPLITEYTDRLGISHELLEKLYVIRKWDIDEVNNPIPFKWPSLLRKTIFNTNKHVDTDEPLRLRQYQLQAVHHLARMPRMILGDSVGLGKTISTLAAFCWLKERYPDYKLVVVTTKSTSEQWADEVARFTQLHPYVMQDKYKGLKSSEARYAQLIQFLEGKKKDVMVVKYSSMIGTRKKIEGKFDEDGNPVKGKEKVSSEIKTFSKIFKEHKQKVILVFDEAHRFKNQGSTRTLVFNLSCNASKVWALTATVISNGLEEFAAVSGAILVNPFGSMWDFKEHFCITRQQYIGKGRHKEVIVGYKNVAEFKHMMRPFFLGRTQKQVKEPLPRLTTVYHPVDLDAKQAKLLLEDIPNGTFQLPPTLVKLNGELYEKERDPDNMMTLLSCQQLVSNHWALLDRNNENDFHTTKLSPKEEVLLEMLEGEYRGEKLVVFSRFKSLIDRLQWLTENKHFTSRKFLRITGDENEKQREEAKRKFQDPTSEYDLIFLTEAGLEGVNLQQSGTLVCFDLPFSIGKIAQLVGRLLRMSSPHSAVLLHILVSKGTIDEYVIDVLKSKNKVFSLILGESATAGLLDNKEVLDLDSGMEDVKGEEEFKSLLKAFVRNVPMSDFLSGEVLTDAQESSETYQMTFERNNRKKRKVKSPKDEIGKHCDEIELL
jgi:SNF2 family DNA or RNA helicase